MRTTTQVIDIFKKVVSTLLFFLKFFSSSFILFSHKISREAKPKQSQNPLEEWDGGDLGLEKVALEIVWGKKKMREKKVKRKDKEKIVSKGIAPSSSLIFLRV